MIRRSTFRHNTSDGLDLLHHSGRGRIRLDRVSAVGNAGNQLKTRGDASLTSSVVVGDCDFFEGRPVTHHVDACRASGDAVALSLGAGDRAVLEHNTIASQGNCLVIAQATGPSSLDLAHNILLGERPGAEDSCYRWLDGPVSVTESRNIIWRARSHACPGRGTRCVDPRLVDPVPESFDP